jgi:hypothetical protein
MNDALASSLHAKHHALEIEIASELKHPEPDQMKVNQMKKEKLRLKEQIEGLVPV